MERLQLDPKLRSLQSPIARLYIENGTERLVDVFWIDYNSTPYKLATLKPHEGTPINTFTKHPWIFIDRVSGQLLHVDNQPVFFGKPFHQLPFHQLQLRQRVIVRLPLKSLQDITLVYLSEHLKDVAVVDKLEIPQILKRDLRNAFQTIEDHKARLLVRPER